MKKLFPCYLFVGESTIRRKETEALAQNLGIDLKTPSPDNFLITPQKSPYSQKQSSIGINQIRQLKSHIFQKPLRSYKLVILEDAQELTAEAQNALLKILEEPPKQVIIVLEAQDKSQLLPTLRSRVITRILYDSIKPKDNLSLIENVELLDQLEKLNQITEPANWLDNQILLLHKLLKNKLERENHQDLQKISLLIERCIQAKKMVKANVDAKFVLFNLILSIN